MRENAGVLFRVIFRARTEFDPNQNQFIWLEFFNKSFHFCRTSGWFAAWITKTRSHSTHRIAKSFGEQSKWRRSGGHATLLENQCATYHRWPRSGRRCAFGHTECCHVRSKCVRSVGHRTRSRKLWCHRTNGTGGECSHFPRYCTHESRWRSQVSCVAFKLYRFVF